MNYSDEFFMSRCIDLARLGLGKVAPNPMVGAVIVLNNKIIGEGFHQQYGEAHAEVNAVNSVSDKSVLNQATIYVSLEPCSHFGKTPPCADLLVKHKFKRVVIGMQDPNAKVNGLGISKLKQAGIDVKVGVLQKECEQLNKAFLTFHSLKRPYIMLKWAETTDGFIDKERGDIQTPQQNWITNESCRVLVHKWRAEYEAILIGTETALKDNPQLNIRSWSGKPPIRIVIDNNLRLPKTLHVFDNSVTTLIFNGLEDKTESNTEFIKIDFSTDVLKQILDILYKKQINSLLVEGGQKTLQEFINHNLYDEANIFVGNKEFKSGTKAPSFSHYGLQKLMFDDSSLFVYR